MYAVLYLQLIFKDWCFCHFVCIGNCLFIKSDIRFFFSLMYNSSFLFIQRHLASCKLFILKHFAKVDIQVKGEKHSIIIKTQVLFLSGKHLCCLFFCGCRKRMNTLLLLCCHCIASVINSSRNVPLKAQGEIHLFIMSVTSVFILQAKKNNSVEYISAISP